MTSINNQQLNSDANADAKVLSKKVKIKRGIIVDPKPLEEFKQELISQKLEAFEQDPSVQIEVTKNENGQSKTSEQIEAEIQAKIKLGNSASNTAKDVKIQEVVTEPLNSAFYVVQYSSLGVDELNSKLEQIQKFNLEVPDKEEQIKAIYQLIKENIEVIQKVNGVE